MTKAEIARFLRGSEPGVLCVTGEYGVGKTFLWRSVLDDLRRSKSLSLERYSYVSLFGLNSLDDMKSSLFENMEWLDQDPTNFVQRGKAGAKALAARAKKLSELAGALPWVGQAFIKARSLYFSLIQSQIVCVDDLDRRSKNLELKDALGLVSFLREQRGCKVALLLNAEKLGEKKEEFDALLEKVVETKVVLAPTAAESAAIALPAQDTVSVALRARPRHSKYPRYQTDRAFGAARR
jgi:Cdc6-like AAA superfamily ATPase